MDTATALKLAANEIKGHAGHVFDILSVARPPSMESALNLVKIVSKLSPLVGNLLEFNVVDLLNRKPEFHTIGRWRRQDPDFPDTVFEGAIEPRPGLEVKAWFPLATEITARFRDSHTRFALDHVSVALLAWLPENLIYGRPRLVDACVVSARSVAVARDGHYHQPPEYIVVEPGDTTARTRNLQQTNTAGYRFQGSREQLQQATSIVASWGHDGRTYKPDQAYQRLVHALRGQFPYRLDTNFAKIDRIEHPEIEAFKTRVLGREVSGITLGEWAVLLGNPDQGGIRAALQDHLGIT